MKNALLKATIVLSVLFAMGSLAPVLAQGSSTVTVQTNAASYSGPAQIMVSGTVAPAPENATAVIVTILNPNNSTVDIQDDAVNPSTGAYSGVTVAGGPITCNGSPCWINGSYIVNATWGGPSGSATAVTTFSYSTSSTSSTSSSSSSSSTSSTSSSSSSTSSSTTSSISTTMSLTTSTSSSSSVSSMVSSTSSMTSTSTASSSSTSSGGSGSTLYIVLAAVVVIAVVLGVFIWRRRVASSYAGQAK